MSTQAIDAFPAAASPRGLKEMVEEYERALILKALADSGGHQRRAARALGVLPTTLNEKMRRLSLRPARAGSESRREGLGGLPPLRGFAPEPPRDRAPRG